MAGRLKKCLQCGHVHSCKGKRAKLVRQAYGDRTGLADPRSRRYPDGREKLYGGDWLQRKAELSERSKDLCERVTVLGKEHDPRCFGQATEPHHIVKRSVQRDDRLSNLADLNHWCHLAEDTRKTRFREKDHA